MAAMILLTLGIQCLYIDSYKMTAQASAALSSQLDIPPAVVDNSTTNAEATSSTDNNLHPQTPDGSNDEQSSPTESPKKVDDFLGQYTIILPNWLTWALLGVSGICFLRTIPWLAPKGK
ncbi:MAG: hypothetical protein CMJ79_11835 [Planctomycetaceae bacterium]|nr:hypothetical protein [Planctomycetaceae bacterium]|tara:strand:- start:300 stop:656 length:357 start_codon:yes stop_codon:yes gene_type:complete